MSNYADYTGKISNLLDWITSGDNLQSEKPALEVLYQKEYAYYTGGSNVLQAILPDYAKELEKNAGKRARKGRSEDAFRQQPIVRQARKIGRNDPCPCGSGKRYKFCHGKKGGGR